MRCANNQNSKIKKIKEHCNDIQVEICKVHHKMGFNKTDFIQEYAYVLMELRITPCFDL